MLVDTSAWIEFFRTPTSPVGDVVMALLRQARACYTGLIVVELYRGAKGHRELDSLDQLFGTIESLHVSEEAYRAAGRLCAQFARRGITVGTVDAMIATVAVEHDCALLSLDRHFKAIAALWQLRLVQI